MQKIDQITSSSILVSLPDRSVKLSFAIQILLRNLHCMHQVWRTKERLTDEQIKQYEVAVKTFGMIWRCLNWKSTVWIHWVVRHSLVFVAKYRVHGLFRFLIQGGFHQARSLKLHIKGP